MNNDLDFKIKVMQEIVTDMQRICDWYIRAIKRQRKVSAALIGYHIFFYQGWLAPVNFYQLRYGWGIFCSVMCLLLVSFLWWAMQRDIDRYRIAKREAAALKLAASAVLAQLQKYRENRFE